MILYSLTVTIELEFVDKWIEYMKSKHIQDVLNTECFTSAQFFEAESTLGNVFRVNYYVKSKELLDRYFSDFAPALRKDHDDLFGEHVSAQRTLLHTLKHFN